MFTGAPPLPPPLKASAGTDLDAAFLSMGPGPARRLVDSAGGARLVSEPEKKVGGVEHVCRRKRQEGIFLNTSIN